MHVCMYVCRHTHTHIATYPPTHLPTHLPTYLPTYIHTYVHALHAYITCVYVCVYIYMYVYTCPCSWHHRRRVQVDAGSKAGRTFARTTAGSESLLNKRCVCYLVVKSWETEISQRNTFPSLHTLQVKACCRSTRP